MSNNATPPPAQQGLSTGANVGIGCGFLFLLVCVLGGMLAMKGCSKLKELAGDLEKNPGKAAATFAVKMNPELELVSTDDAKGEITFKNKKTGEVTTMSFDEMKQGKFKVRDAQGNETVVDGSSAGQGKVTMKGPDGEMVIGGTGAETALPAWLLPYPGAAVTPGGMRMEKQGVVSGMSAAKTADPVAKVQAFYEEKLKAVGFEVQVTSVGGPEETTMLTATKDDGKQTANVVIHRENGETQIAVTYEGPK